MRIDKPQSQDIPRLKELWKLGFFEPEEMIRRFFDAGFSKDRAMAAWVDGEAAAAVYWFEAAFQGQRLAYIFALTTDPALRGRGIARELMGSVHSYLRQRGYAGVLLYPGQPSLREFYRELGYANACTWGEITVIANRPGDRQGMALIGPEEYDALRQRYLPEAGAHQPGPSIAYLATYAKLYRGKDFLLAAVKEGNTLYGLELLGSTAGAADILAALDCREGTFRVPGKDIPGAMFLALEEGAVPPDYFGLTFD